jgi:hypothetical protein
MYAVLSTELAAATASTDSSTTGVSDDPTSLSRQQ